jgi:hypothetical protein
VPRIVEPFPRLIGRAEAAPELILYRDGLNRSVESLVLHAAGLGSPTSWLWRAFAIDERTPDRDPRVVALKAAKELLAQHWPELAAMDDLRVFQVLATDRTTTARVNRGVRGMLTARLVPDPDNPRKPFIQLGFDLHPDEPAHVSHFTVFQWNDQGRSSAIVLWDVASMNARSMSAAEVRAMIRKSLPAGGPRSRWDGLEEEAILDEIPSIYFETAIEQPESSTLASRALARLEASVRAGKPSRNSQLEWVPLHDPTALPEELGGLEESDSVLATPVNPIGEDDRVDLNRAGVRLNSRNQEILRLYSRGFTDEEIASTLGITHQAVNRARHRALDKLRELMSG